jgi:DNA polymerase-3 subunit gamma/tau
VGYLVLARKWRPARFADLVGQAHVARTLENAIRQGRVAHAYLFSGPRGVGKTSTARILAAALNCEKGPTPEPCGTCPHCVEIAAGRSLDVLEIDGASNRGIDEVRDLRENVRYMASAGKRKVYIIDEVHMLTVEAFNALLKTLEEPPAHVLFVFATTRPTKVPATILSRVIRFDFRRIDAKSIVARLQEILKAEKIEAEEKALHLVARAADGSMRDALSLLEQACSYGGGKLAAAETEEALGVVDEEHLFAISRAARESTPLLALETIEETIARGRDPSDFLIALEEHFRNLLVARVSKSPSALVDAAEETVARYREEAAHFQPDDLIRMLTLLGEGGRDLRFSPKPRLVLEMLLLRLVRMDSTVAIGEVLRRLEGAPGGAGKPAPRAATPDAGRVRPTAPEGPSRPAPAPPASSPAANAPARAAPTKPSAPAPPKKRAAETKDEAPPSASAATPKDDEAPSVFRAKWGDFLKELQKENAALAALLHGSRPEKVEAGAVEIAFPRDASFQLDQILEAENRKAVEAAIESYFRSGRRVRGVLGTHAGESERERRAAIRDDPRIGRILDMLDGEIIG